MIAIRIENLLTHESDTFQMSRVPCIGEQVTIWPEDNCYEVKEVMHLMVSDPDMPLVAAIVRVK